jgi:hypothetical protein
MSYMRLSLQVIVCEVFAVVLGKCLDLLGIANVLAVERVDIRWLMLETAKKRRKSEGRKERHRGQRR